MSGSGPPPASVRDDLTILGLCSMYECSEPAVVERRRQPGDLGGIVLDIALCGECAAHFDQNLADSEAGEA